MNPGPSTTNQPRIGYQLMTYLVEHPEAQDTLEGIMEWWLLERQIKFQTDRVKDALSELVSRGMILEQKGSDSQTRYRINKARYKKIQELVNRING